MALIYNFQFWRNRNITACFNLSICALTRKYYLKEGSRIKKLTFRFKTPHLEKSAIFKLYLRPDGSEGSDRIWQDRSLSGSTPLSSANSGWPLNPSGFFSFATIESLIPTLLLMAKVHWISVTGRRISLYVLFAACFFKLAHKSLKNMPFNSKNKNRVNIVFFFCFLITL